MLTRSRLLQRATASSKHCLAPTRRPPLLYRHPRNRSTMPNDARVPDPTCGPRVNVALVQLRGPDADIRGNVDNMRAKVLQAVAEGQERGAPVHMAVLGEIWNIPMLPEQLFKHAEPIPSPGSSDWSESPTVRAMAGVAKEGNLWLIGGSIAERAGDKIYNTATVFSPSGELVQTYRKTHLFDLCLPKMTYKESDTFAAGDRLATFTTPFGKFGVAICYDLRFAEIAMLAAREGCMGVFYPAAFNTHTGPLHWELLQRARALDNQIYVSAVSTAHDASAKYPVYGHSMAVSPMGAVVATAEAEPAIVHATLDPQVIADTRAGIPLLNQRRFDIYADISKA